jgi:hypothetical protein
MNIPIFHGIKRKNKKGETNRLYIVTPEVGSVKTNPVGGRLNGDS